MGYYATTALKGENISSPVFRSDKSENRLVGLTNTYSLGLGNRLASWTGGSYGHDAAGCVTNIADVSRPDLSLTWNSQYQLTAVATNGALAESYLGYIIARGGGALFCLFRLPHIRW